MSVSRLSGSARQSGSDLARSRWRFKVRGGHTRTFLRALGIDFREVEGQDFWEANALLLPDIFEQIQEEVRSRFHDLHPDKGGDAAEFRDFLDAYNHVKRRFARYLSCPISTPLPASVTFIPAVQVRRNKKAAQARERRRKNRKAFRASRRAAYARRKADGWKESAEKRREISRRYRQRHPRKIRNCHRHYCQAYPEKVRRWSANYRVSATARGVKIKGGPESKKRLTPGTPEYERRQQWRREYHKINRDRINACRRVKVRLPRHRDHKGRYLPAPLAAAA